MDTVLKFDPSRRSASSVGTGYLVCDECRGAYFELVEITADGEKPGVVTLNPDGTVAGRTGTPRCANCGRDKTL